MHTRHILLLSLVCLPLATQAQQPTGLRKFRDRVSKNFKFRHIIWQEDLVPPTTSTVNQSANSQQSTPRTQAYLPLVYRDTKSQQTQPFSVCSRKLFAVIKMDKTTPVVDFWSITNNASPDSAGTTRRYPCLNPATVIGPALAADGNTAQDWRFELDLSRRKLGDKTRQVWVPFRTFTLGVSTIPIRIRSKYEGRVDYKDKTSSGSLIQRADTLPATATAQVNASLNAGFTWGRSYFTHRGINNYAFTVGPFVGLSSADLRKTSYINPADYRLDLVLPALSYGINAIVSRNNLGLVFSYGYDHAFGANRNYWVYQHRPWFGVGVSTSISFF